MAADKTTVLVASTWVYDKKSGKGEVIARPGELFEVEGGYDADPKVRKWRGLAGELVHTGQARKASEQQAEDFRAAQGGGAGEEDGTATTKKKRRR